MFLDEFGDALTLSGSRRGRVLAEAHDHLAEAKERGIKAGLEPEVAEAAAVEAFGDPAYLAARFEADFRTRALGRLTGALDTIDSWRADHPVAGATSMIAPLAVIFAVYWSPLVAVGVAPIWIVYAWLGKQLVSRHEPGYRRRLWSWKREHTTRYNVVTGLAASAAFVWAFGATNLYPTHHFSLVTIAVLAPVYAAVWILNNPRPFKPPRSTS